MGHSSHSPRAPDNSDGPRESPFIVIGKDSLRPRGGLGVYKASQVRSGGSRRAGSRMQGGSKYPAHEAALRRGRAIR